MKKLKNFGDRIKAHDFFQDGWVMSFLFVGVALIALSFIWSVTHIRQTDLLIPVKFTSLANFELGHWFELYELLIISAVTFVTNLILGLLLHRQSRLISIFLLFISVMVSALSLAILIGFTSVNYGPI